MSALTSSMLLLSTLAQQRVPSPPPADMRAMNPRERAFLEAAAVAPPPSPPYAFTPAGQREKGRGILLQRELESFLATKLETLRRGSEAERQAALTAITLMAVETTIYEDDPHLGGRSSWLSSVHPVAFRKACVAHASRSAKGDGSIVEAIAALVVDDSLSDATKSSALQAMAAIATDDPDTDVDNDHALGICATGAVPNIVTLLSHGALGVQEGATAAVAALVENEHCAKMFLGYGVVDPLIALSQYGADGVRRYASSAHGGETNPPPARQGLAVPAAKPGPRAPTPSPVPPPPGLPCTLYPVA